MNLLLLTLILTFAGASGSGIVWGHESAPHSRPYMVSLQVNGFHSCGGILIREDFVLTAAHCKKDGMTLDVVLGAHNISMIEDTQKSSVATYHPHPKYIQNGYEDDIMLLKLKKKATLKNDVKTIELPPKDVQIPLNTVCVVTGWGKTGHSESSPSAVLKEVKVKTEDMSKCKNEWKYLFNIQNMICTHPEGKGFCQGDSGGPLICNKMPLGIVAYCNRAKCDDLKTPCVYMNIPYFVPWITKVLKDNPV